MFVSIGLIWYFVRCGQYADAASTRIGNYCGMLHGTWNAAASSANRGEVLALAIRTMTRLLPHQGGENSFFDLCALDVGLDNGSVLPEDFRFVSKTGRNGN